MQLPAGAPVAVGGAVIADIALAALVIGLTGLTVALFVV